MKGETFANSAPAADEITSDARERSVPLFQDGSRRKGPWRLAPMPPRTQELAGALLDDIQQIVREELRPLHALIQSIADGARRPESTAGSDPNELLTVDQVAEAVKVIPATVRTWIHSGKLRAIRPGVGRGPGRTFRIARGDLQNFLESVRERVTDSEVDVHEEAKKILAIVARRRKT